MCDQNASMEELKKSYQNLVLKYHPDKQCQNTETFIRLNEAWNILRDLEKRKAYDAELQQKKFNENRIVHEVVNLSKDFRYDRKMNNYTRDCRCGGLFVVSEEDVSDSYFECDECSLVILIRL